ncbi:hypothetical protein OsJ_34814 [Oryza sativa Japonica Group]|uniref:Uncharacterized protein n=4 Tax=Oryza TaxID=4527 RepID=Q2QZN5_ORYSJ|nr:hypothetical protein LOC_Os11g45380 [Oryza sativa Japonica Group]EAZ19273.1 hypothetical protein OsJ_34814 [Oryza sativa Japonica Group]
MTKATSMHGWTRLDLVKGAMKMVTNKLGAGDRLAIVPFNGKVVAAGATRLMEMTTKGRADANAKVNQLKAGGDTKFLPALKHASGLLDSRPAGDKQYRPGFIFLLSDGQDNGVLDDKLGGVRYPAHTFGMCQSRCNPKSMVHIATATKGSYHPIDDKLSNVAQALAVFLSGITSAVAVNARVQLHVADNSGVLINKIDSGAYDKTIESGNGKASSKGTINVGVLSAEEDKKFIVYLDVPKLENAQAKPPQLLLTVAGEYSTPAGGRKVENMEESSVQVERPAPAGGATKTGDHLVTWSEAVMVEMVRVKVVSIVKEVLKKHEHDEEPDQKQMAKDLMEEWDKFIKETPAGKDAAERLKEKLPKHHVEDMRRSLTKEEHDGVLYLYSWLASHQTQQATTMASSPPAGVSGWFHQQYMKQVAVDAEFDACGIQPGVETTEIDATADCGCVVGLQDRIDRRLELWSNLKREAPLMFQPSEDAESHHLTAVFREASLDAINRAMHHDMYLAVVHASNLRRCYSGAGKQQLHGYGSSELPAHDDEALPATRAVEKHSE